MIPNQDSFYSSRPMKTQGTETRGGMGCNGGVHPGHVIGPANKVAKFESSAQYTKHDGMVIPKGDTRRGSMVSVPGVDKLPSGRDDGKVEV